MKVLVIDNYDSFVYNIVHYLEGLGAEVVIVRNNQLTMKDIEPFNKILISPGPGLPKDAGIINDVIEEFASSKSILGICLGHQAIAETFGCELKNFPEVYHGVSHLISQNNNSKLFFDLPETFNVGRYHSWGVSKLSDQLEVTAVDNNGEVMALKHKKYDIEGVQFHPESVLTEFGKELLTNWLKS